MVKPIFWALLGPPHFPPFYRFTGFKKLISSVKVWQVSSWKYACFCFFGRGIDWWHFRKCPKNRVARFHTAGLPDYEISAYLCILKRRKGLKFVYLFFLDGESTGDIFESLRRTGLPDFALQGCQIMKFRHILAYWNGPSQTPSAYGANTITRRSRNLFIIFICPKYPIWMLCCPNHIFILLSLEQHCWRCI